MTTITISRQFGSGGDEIANQACEILGYRFFDKRLIAQAAAASGLSEQEIIDYSEENYKVRKFLDRLLGRSQTVAQVRIWKEDSVGARDIEEITMSEEAALALVQNAIRSAYIIGNVVIVGRGGQVLLKDMPDVVHVRITAPIEDRIQRVKEQLKRTRQSFDATIDIRRQAQDRIIERDTASADYLKRFYNVDWDDPALYHVVLNTGKLGIDQAAHCLTRMVSEFSHSMGTADLPLVHS